MSDRYPNRFECPLCNGVSFVSASDEVKCYNPNCPPEPGDPKEVAALDVLLEEANAKGERD